MSDLSTLTIPELRARLLILGWKQVGNHAGLMQSPGGVVANLSDDCPEFLRPQIIADVVEYLCRHAPEPDTLKEESAGP